MEKETKAFPESSVRIVADFVQVVVVNGLGLVVREMNGRLHAVLLENITASRPVRVGDRGRLFYLKSRFGLSRFQQY